MATGDKLVNLDGLKTVYDSIQGQFTDMHNNVAPAIVDTASGAIATVEDGADDLPMRSVVAQIEPVQEGSGDPSPTNVRPITGWTGASAVRTGKNLLKLDASEMVSDGWMRLFPISIKAGTYTLSCVNTFGHSGTNGAKVVLMDSNHNDIALLSNDNYTFGDSSLSCPSVTITEEQAEKTAYITFRMRTSGTTASDIQAGNIQLESGSTATAYEPYRGSTITTDWQSVAGTVYGGTVDVVSGLLTVDRAMVDLGDLTWTSETSSVTGLFRTNGNSMSQKPKVTGKLVCTQYNGIQQAASNISDGAISVTNTQAVPLIRVRDIENLNDKTDAQAKEFLTGVKLVYELATPVTYQLTKQEVRTLLGINHIYADTGNVSIIYPADTKLYIDNKIAALQALILEN